MMIELKKIGLDCRNQFPIKVFYEKEIIGEYFADLFIEQKIIVELKAIKILTKQNESQLLNYLTATNVEVGLLLNFGEKPEFKRKIFDNEYKTYNSSQIHTDKHG